MKFKEFDKLVRELGFKDDDGKFGITIGIWKEYTYTYPDGSYLYLTVAKKKEKDEFFASLELNTKDNDRIGEEKEWYSDKHTYEDVYNYIVS